MKALPPKNYKYLLMHRHDDRYSYSIIGPWGSPISSGWFNCSVGHAIDKILSNELSWVGGYKSREGGTPPTFHDYVEAHGGYDKWVTSVSSLSRKEIDVQFLEWCINMEMDRGFANDEDRERILNRYKTAIQEANNEQSPTQSESDGGDTTQSESEEHSR